MRQNFSGVIRDNIHWYYNQSIEIDGVQIILSILWSQIPSNINERIQCHSNDFHCIHYKGSPITIDQYNKENNLCVNFIIKVVVDGNLITGQNPFSSEEIAKAILQ